MKETRNVRFGKICLKHPNLNGERYAGNNTCVQCGKELSKYRHAQRTMTIGEELTMLRSENFRLKSENRSLRHRLGESGDEK